MRIYQIFVSLLCIALGGLTSLTSFAMVFSMIIAPETRTENLFWIAVIALILSPPIFIAGWRLLLNKPNKFGGVLTPFMLRLMAIVIAVIVGVIIILAYREGDFFSMFIGLTFLITTQGAFFLAHKMKNKNHQNID